MNESRHMKLSFCLLGAMTIILITIFSIKPPGQKGGETVENSVATIDSTTGPVTASVSLTPTIGTSIAKSNQFKLKQ